MNGNENLSNENIAEKSENNGTITVKRNKKIDFIAKLVCLLIAFFIWYYVSGIDTAGYEKTFYSIPVEIVNNGAYSVLSGDDAEIDITVRAQRSIVNRLGNDSFRVYVDISGATQAGNGKYEIQYELPTGVELVKSSADKIMVYADNTLTVSVPVKVKIGQYALDSGYEFDEGGIITDVSVVSVTGPDAIVSTIDCALLYADIGHVKDTVTYSGSIVLADEEGRKVNSQYIKVDIPTVKATIPVYKYRDVPIEVEFKHGYIDSSNYKITVDPAFITIKGSPSAIDSVKLSYVLDEKSISRDTVYNYPVFLPEGVFNVSGEKEITISVKLTGMSAKTLIVKNITTLTPTSSDSYTVPSSIAVVIMGSSSVIDRVTEDSVMAVIDLSAVNLSVGEKTKAPVSFVFKDTGVYEIGPYTADVTRIS